MIEQTLAESAIRIDGVLDSLLSVPSINPEAADLYEAMRYSTLLGGKRIRPFLVIESARLCGVSEAQAVWVAAALEIMHTYSLIHDDLPAMDNSDYRRGQPSCHKKFCEATAILAGDALQPMAFELLCDERVHTDPKIRLALVQELAKASGARGMVGGQMMDLAAANLDMNLEQVERLQALKTGALFSFACLAGPILAGSDPKEIAAMRTYAECFGLVFQMTDDLLDLEGDAHLMGKPTGQDADKSTFISVLGADKTKEKIDFLIQKAENALVTFAERGNDLKALLHMLKTRKS